MPFDALVLSSRAVGTESRNITPSFSPANDLSNNRGVQTNAPSGENVRFNVLGSRLENNSRACQLTREQSSLCWANERREEAPFRHELLSLHITVRP